MRSTQTKKAICLRKARFLPCLPFIYRFFSLPNRAENLRYQNWTNKNSCRSSAKLSAWWAHCVCRDKSVQAGIKKSCRSFAKLSAWLAHFVRSFLCLRKARFLPCLPFIYRFFSLPNRAPLLKQRCGYGNHLKCHSEEQSDVGIP